MDVDERFQTSVSLSVFSPGTSIVRVDSAERKKVQMKRPEKERRRKKVDTQLFFSRERQDCRSREEECQEPEVSRHIVVFHCTYSARQET